MKTKMLHEIKEKLSAPINELFFGRSFDHEFYGTYYGDLTHLPGRSVLLRHFARHGKREGRFPNLTAASKALQLPPDFDLSLYRSVNKDLSKVLKYDWEYEKHFAVYGRNEGRRYWDIEPFKGNGKPIVYARRGDGMGTRISTAIHARIFAELFGLELKIIWPQLEEPQYREELFGSKTKTELFEYDHFFETEGIQRGDFVTDNAVEGTVLRLCNIREQLLGVSREEFQSSLSAYDSLLYDWPGPVPPFLGYEVDCSSRTKELWKLIAWNKEFLSEVEEIFRTLSLSDCIAAHVRRGNIGDLLMYDDPDRLRNDIMLQLFQRYAPIEAYQQEIDRIRTNEIVLLCCEDIAVVDTFKRKYGRDNVYSSFELFPNVSETQRTLIDIMLLAKCKTIIAPFISYFSGCAASVGDGTLISLRSDPDKTARDFLATADSIADPTRRSQMQSLINTTAAEFAEELRRS